MCRYWLKSVALLLLLFCFKQAAAQKIFRTEVYFDFGKDILLPDGKDSLDAFFELVEHIETAKIYIRGHTDSVGGFSSNDNLGMRRAKRVFKYLWEKGIPEDRMVCRASGEHKPQANNGTDRGRAKNRRVSIAAKYDYYYTQNNSFYPHYSLGATVTLQTRFEFNSTEIKDESFQQLNAMADTLLAYPNLQIEIGGHVALTATKDKWLSTGRAEAVYEYLIARGVPEDRMTFIGWGADRKICKKSQEELCIKQNRRVEVTIVGK